MQREINDKVFLGNKHLPTMMQVNLLLLIEQLLIIMMPRKRYKKPGSLLKHVDMMKILPDFRVCSKT